MDIRYPFVRVDIERQVEAKNYRARTHFHSRLAALIMVFALTRFAGFSLLPNLTGDCAAVTFLNDWVRYMGKPGRLISDIGCPGFTGAAWASLGNIFGLQDVRAHAGTAYQNGLCERAVRQVKIASRAIMVEEGRSQPDQLILTWETIAKNHAPHATTGIPPAYGMAGRCDILSCYSATAWQPDPSSDSLMLDQTSPMVKITQARNATMAADASNRIGRCIRRNLRDRAIEPFAVGGTVQLAIGKAWAGPRNVIAVTSGNIAVGRGKRLVKCPKCRDRAIRGEMEEPPNSVPIPDGNNGTRAIIPDGSNVDARSEIDFPSDIDPEIDME